MIKTIFNYDKLRGKIKEKYSTLTIFSRELGISRTALSERLNNKSNFSDSEMLKACELLEIPLEKVQEYFFNVYVQKNEL